MTLLISGYTSTLTKAMARALRIPDKKLMNDICEIYDTCLQITSDEKKVLTMVESLRNEVESALNTGQYDELKRVQEATRLRLANFLIQKE